MEGRIHSIETSGMVDGPGIRYVIFTQGCLLRCNFVITPILGIVLQEKS